MRIALVTLAVLTAGCATAQSISAPPAPPPSGGMIRVQDFTTEDLAGPQSLFDALVYSGEKHVTFNIDSYGGSIFAGFEFIKHVESFKKQHGVTTTCIVDVKAYSMGFAFLQSGACDERLMTKRSTLLAHGGSTRLQGNAEDLKSGLAFLQNLDRALAEMIAGRMGMPVANYLARVKGTDWTMSWADAVGFNAVDGTIDAKDLPFLL